jgi:hypothetical protein
MPPHIKYSYANCDRCGICCCILQYVYCYLGATRCLHHEGRNISTHLPENIVSQAGRLHSNSCHKFKSKSSRTYMKGKKYIALHVIKVHWRLEVQLHPSLTLAKPWSKWSNSMPPTLCQYNIPSTQRMENWVDPGAIWMLCRREKSLAPVGNWTTILKSCSSSPIHYTKCTFPAS